MRILKKYRSAIQIAFGVIAVGFLVWIVAKNWHDITRALAGMNVWLLVLSLVLAFAGTILSAVSWRSIVQSFGIALDVRTAGEIMFTAQIGKYIPGGVWPVVAGAQIGSRVGLAAPTMVATMALQIIIGLVTGAVVSVGTLLLVPVLAQQYWWLIALVLLIGVVLLLPPVLRRLLAWGFRVIRRSDLLPGLSGGHLGMAILWYLASWLAFGLHLWVLFSAVKGFHPGDFVPAASGYALSWVVGFLAVFAPAGAGVREAILVLLFSASLGAATILGVALVSRIVLIVVDLVMFGAAIGSRALRREPVRLGAAIATAHSAHEEGEDPR